MLCDLTKVTLKAIQFSAILGDLTHKQDVYCQRQLFGPNVTCLFDNFEQARFLQVYFPGIVPPGYWSTHALGTFFEHCYQSSLDFRFSYLRHLPTLTCQPPLTSQDV